MSVINGDRPTKHGSLLGEALALIADLGERYSPIPMGERCSTCAFRKGSVPNQSAGTGMIALNCVLGIDRDRFACHHGMKDGEPKRICVGYMAAILAPFSQVKEVLVFMHENLGKDDGEDDVREAFDKWLHDFDPKGKLDVYQVARAYQKRPTP